MSKVTKSIIDAIALDERIREIARDELSRATGGDSDPWIDQKSSPLGHRNHLRLAARGELAGSRKVGRRVLIRRSILDAYIEKNGIPATAVARVIDPALDEDERALASVGARRVG